MLMKMSIVFVICSFVMLVNSHTVDHLSPSDCISTLKIMDQLEQGCYNRADARIDCVELDRHLINLIGKSLNDLTND